MKTGGTDPTTNNDDWGRGLGRAVRGSARSSPTMANNLANAYAASRRDWLVKIGESPSFIVEGLLVSEVTCR